MGRVTSRILVDANVLYSRTLRDWLLLIQSETPGMFRTCWTEDILAETVHHIRRNNPLLDGGAVTVVRDRMVAAMSERIEAFVVKEFAPLTDEHDLHVHAAAVDGQVSMVLTNDKGFLDLPDAVTDMLPYEVIDADSLFVLIDDSSPETVRRVTARVWGHLRKKDPAADVAQLLVQAGCPRFAQRVRHHQRELR